MIPLSQSSKYIYTVRRMLVAFIWWDNQSNACVPFRKLHFSKFYLFMSVRFSSVLHIPYSFHSEFEWISSTFFHIKQNEWYVFVRPMYIYLMHKLSFATKGWKTEMNKSSTGCMYNIYHTHMHVQALHKIHIKVDAIIWNCPV